MSLHLVSTAILPAAPVENPTVVLDEAALPGFRIAAYTPGKAQLSLVGVGEQSAGEEPGGVIMRLETLEPASPAYRVKAAITNSAHIKEGDTLWLNFRMRTVQSPLESGEGELEVVMEDREHFHKSFTFRALAGSEWKEFAVPITARETLAPGESEFHMRIGHQKQVLDVAGLKLLNYGPAQAKSELPSLGQEITYAGMEEGAAWRMEALQRIQTLRKAPLTVQVRDAAGQPAAGVRLQVRQLTHRYGFGSAISASHLAAVAESDTPYQAAVRRMFNTVTMENDLKWRQWEQDSATPLAAAKWATEAGLRVRGHTMVWPAWRRIPTRLKQLEHDHAALQAEVLRHVDDIGTRTGGLITDWDVMNEPYSNHDLIDVLGKPAMVQWFAQAAKSAPGTRLFVNDYGIINGEDLAHRAHFTSTIAYLLEHGAPLGGIGIQGHFGKTPAAPERVLKVLDQFGEFNLPIQMTEFSLDVDDPELSARYLRDLMITFFSHPATDAFVLWCFKEGVGWHNTAALYDKEWELTAAGKVWQDLVQREWWTTAEMVTDAQGEASLQGFHGEYEITLASADANVPASRASLPPGGTVAELVLPAQTPTAPATAPATTLEASSVAP